jgi:hypothetical protein
MDKNPGTMSFLAKKIHKPAISISTSDSEHVDQTFISDVDRWLLVPVTIPHSLFQQHPFLMCLMCGLGLYCRPIGQVDFSLYFLRFQNQQSDVLIQYISLILT